MELEQLSGRSPICPDRNARYRSRVKLLLEMAFGFLMRADLRCILELLSCSQWVAKAEARARDDEAVTWEEGLYEEPTLP